MRGLTTTTSIEELDLIVREVRQRVTRMESWICRIADHLKVYMRTPKDGFRIRSETAEKMELSVPMLDISLSELLNCLHKEELDQKAVHVYFGGSQVATLCPHEILRL
jgi:hypothetical protein